MNDKSKNTPGPWRYTKICPFSLKEEEDANHDAIMYKGRVVMYAGDGSDYMAEFNFKTKADKNLVLAAPDLLEALEKVYEGLCLLDDDKFAAMKFLVSGSIKKAKGL